MSSGYRRFTVSNAGKAGTIGPRPLETTAPAGRPGALPSHNLRLEIQSTNGCFPSPNHLFCKGPQAGAILGSICFWLLGVPGGSTINSRPWLGETKTGRWWTKGSDRATPYKTVQSKVCRHFCCATSSTTKNMQARSHWRLVCNLYGMFVAI